jgi:hypothetical protein
MTSILMQLVVPVPSMGVRQKIAGEIRMPGQVVHTERDLQWAAAVYTAADRHGLKVSGAAVLPERKCRSAAGARLARPSRWTIAR